MSDDRKSKNEVFQGGKGEVPPAVQQHIEAISKMSGDGDTPAAAPAPRPVIRTPDGVGANENIMDMLQRDFGIKIPTESVPLPSRGLLYPPQHPFHRREVVDIKMMTAVEEDILTSQSLLKKGTVITELIKSCLVDNVNPNDLLSGDRNALMIAIRITGYGARYDGEVTCSECGAKTPRDFNLADLDIKSLKIEPAVEGQNVFDFKLPRLKAPVQFRFLTGRDEEDILKTSERQKKLGISQDNLVTTNLIHSIVSVNGVDDRAKLSHFVRMMPASDSNDLRRYIKENEPGVDMKVESECKACGHVEEVAMPIGVTFLWPNAE